MDELYKSGLAKDDNDESNGGVSVHATVTALLYQQWNGKELAASTFQNVTDLHVSCKFTGNK